MTGHTGKYGGSPFLFIKDFYYFMAALNAKAFKAPCAWLLVPLPSCLAWEGHSVLQGRGAPLRGDTKSTPIKHRCCSLSQL